MKKVVWVLALVGCSEVTPSSGLPVEQAAMPQVATLTVSSDHVEQGSSFQLAVEGALPGASMFLIRGTGGLGPGICPALWAGSCADISDSGPEPTVLWEQIGPADSQGLITRTYTIPASVPSLTYALQAVYPRYPDPAVGTNPVLLTIGPLPDDTADTGLPPDPVTPFDLAAARFRSFGNTGGGELYVGVPDLGVGSNRAESNATWVTGDNAFGVTHDATTDALTATLSNSAGSWSTTWSGGALTDPGCDLSRATHVIVTLADRDAGGSVDLTALTVDGVAMPSMAGNGGWQDVELPADVRPGFSMSGTLALSGSFGNSQEASKLELKVACR